MGREIRRVPANWQHPQKEGYGEERYQPLFDESYLKALNEWITEHNQWEKGEHPDQQGKDRSDCRYYAQWGGNPPDVEYYRPDWKPEEMTWYQMYETVSEGTPVTPPFETQDELIDYLVANGDFWDQNRRKEGRSIIPCQPWHREDAETFVKERPWMPSMAILDGKILSGSELAGFKGVKSSRDRNPSATSIP